MRGVTGGLKMLNSGGIKLSTCKTLTSKIRGCEDAGPGGIPHVARFIFNTELIISEIPRRTGHNSETLRITFALKFHHFHYEIVDLRQLINQSIQPAYLGDPTVMILRPSNVLAVHLAAFASSVRLRANRARALP